MEQQHQTLFHLVEFPFLSAEIQPHFQSFFESIFKGRYGRWRGWNPKGRDANGCGMPSKPVRGSDVRFVQRLFEKAVDTEVGAGHAHQLR